MSAEQKRILIIDDEELVRESLSLILSRRYVVDSEPEATSGLERLRSVGQQASGHYDCVLLDLMMPGIDGITALGQIRGLEDSLPVVMLTASGSVSKAVEAMKLGAVDYLSKPYDVDELLALLETVIKEGTTADFKSAGSFHHERGIPANGNFGILSGEHPLMLEIFEKIDQVAPRDATVLISGESGTGKELVAREIHRRSTRSEKAFIALNCAAIPESLIESELFGHVKGAFTHALDARVGQFKLADQGTLFLDEIGELSPAVQVKMLRFLSDREFCKVGSSTPEQVDVRILAATNKNLQQAVERGEFRKDLFYRVNVVNLELPPLRRRQSDIPQLIEIFIQKLSPLYRNRRLSFEDVALETLLAYEWPGNVRELENAVESLLALSNTETVSEAELPRRFFNNNAAYGEKNAAETEENQGKEFGLLFEEAEREFEMDIILRALKKADFVQTRAAEILGISRRILKYKMDKLGIDTKQLSSDSLAA